MLSKFLHSVILRLRLGKWKSLSGWQVSVKIQLQDVLKVLVSILAGLAKLHASA